MKREPFRLRQVTVLGETKAVSEWCAENGISVNAVFSRVTKLGWPLDKAVSVAKLDNDEIGYAARHNMRRFAKGKGVRRGVGMLTRALSDDDRCSCPDCNKQRAAVRTRGVRPETRSEFASRMRRNSLGRLAAARAKAERL